MIVLGFALVLVVGLVLGVTLSRVRSAARERRTVPRWPVRIDAPPSHVTRYPR